MKRVSFIVLLLVVAAQFGEIYAQIPGARIPPRDDDHFWRRKIVSRIDLTEKINEPLVAVEDVSMYSNPRYGETNGMIQALLNGLKSGKYLAYLPDTLTKSLTYEDVVKRAQKIDGGGGGDSGGDDWDDSGDGFDDFDAGDDFGGDDFGDDFGGDDFGDDMGGEGDSDPFGQADPNAPDFQIAPYETCVEFIEDRIFDKNRSDMVYDVQYIRLVWVDPGETLPDKNFICFKYADVLETLEDTQWKNKYNDAEYRNLREIWELRLFNSFIISVSGRGVPSLELSDYRRTQLVEFEHHLWSY